MLTCSLPRCAQGGQRFSGYHDGQIHPLSAARAMKGWMLLPGSALVLEMATSSSEDASLAHDQGLACAD